MAGDDDRSLQLARFGMIGAGIVGLGLVAVSIWSLLGISSPDPLPVAAAPPVELAAEAPPEVVETARAAPVDSEQVQVQQAAPMTSADFEDFTLASLDWAPAIDNAASVIDFSVTVAISDGGTETFGIADSSSGIRGLRGGETNSYKVREGELILVQDTPSGWPNPEIECDDGNAWSRASVVLLTLKIGPAVSCTITNTRDADSLSVLDVEFSCDGISGDMRGPQGPFMVSYRLFPVDGSGSAEVLDLGAFRVDEPGRFVAPYWSLEQMPADGEYLLTVITQDFSGSLIALQDAAIVDPRACPK